MYFPSHHGFVEMIVGPMYSGKSEELIRRLKRAQIAKQKVQIFKPILDNRYAEDAVVSHGGNKISCESVGESMEILPLLDPETKVVGIDEVQFFDENLCEIIEALSDKGIRVICAGLDMDFRGKPFGIVPRLLSMAEFVDKLTAVCVCCGQPATRTQRLVDGVPARFEDETILVGAKEHYEARCRAHHQVAGERR